jgi:4-amino-4-deoxy-L-arabinose transferase-like glycosyltransferase
MTSAKRKPKPKPQIRGKTRSRPAGEIEFSIKPGAKTTLTIEAGKQRAGEVLVRIRVEGEKARRSAKQVEAREEAPGFGARAIQRLEWLGGIRAIPLGLWLFVGAIAIYLATRLIGLDRFPIYFFTDEAFQTQAMVELIQLGYRNVEGTFLPAYFGNGMGFTVYLQWLPLLLFGKSAVLTRAVSAAVTVIAALAVGVILRDVLRARYWWAGALFLSFTPSWFLHSRTAFETGVFVAFYAAALCAYLLYRNRSPVYFYWTALFGALAFYSYNPAQLMVPVTAALLLLSDWRYHWEQRDTVLKGGVLLAFLAVPYIRYRIIHPDASGNILHLLGSYLVSDISLVEKARLYISEYFFGLSAYYWFVPNDRDQIRHIMKDYGHIMLATFPLFVAGLAHLLRNLREPAYRALLFIMLISPIGGAMVQIGITRSLVFVVPAAILTTLGLERILRWVEDPARALKDAEPASPATVKRVAVSLGIFLAGAILAFTLDKTIDQIFVAALAGLLGLHGSGVFDALKRGMQDWFPVWKLPSAAMPLLVFAALAGTNFFVLNDALKNGPLWWTNYGETQYGAFQIYEVIEDYHEEHPQARIIFTSSWANGADVLNRFFIGVQPWLDVGSIEGYIQRKFPMDENTVFVMTPLEYSVALNSDRLTDVRLEQTVPYPDGSPAFHFVRLRYVDNIDEIFAAERAVRAVLQEAVASVGGQEVGIRHTYLDAVSQADTIRLIFDNDTYTYAKTFEDNPFVIELTYPAPVTVNGFSLMIGSANIQVTLTSYPAPGAEPLVYTFEGKGSVDEPVISFDLPQAVNAQVLRFEVLDPYSPPPAQIHIWELTLR